MEKLSRREREQLERTEIMIDKAGELFNKYGFDKVSMDDLAKESEFTKRTLYRYFTCKEDLIFAVAVKGYSRLLEDIKSKCHKGDSGFDKVRLSYYAYYDYFCRYPQIIHLINMSSTIKSNSADNDIPYRQKFMNIDKSLFEELTGMFLEGKADGSISSELEIPMLALSSIYVAVGFFQMLSMSGDSYTKHFGMEKDAFVQFTIEMLLKPLKAKQRE